jgi:hypothetical protein
MEELETILAGFAGSRILAEHPYKGWHCELQNKYALHPCVKQMMKYPPKDIVQLALEYPHVSEKDATRLAYTRNASDGVNNRQLVTSIGKYLARHWSEVEDHHRRDVQATYSPDTLVIRSTTPEIIQGIEDGPRSCMASAYNSIPFKDYHKEQMQEWFKDPAGQTEPDWSLHPYSAYKPEFGWSIALRITPAGKIDGRALIYKHTQGQLMFLRTYRRHPTEPDGWSQTDHTLQEWLKYQGYEMVSEWPMGAKLHTPAKGSDIIFAPYIDGENKALVFDGKTTSVFAYRSECTHWCESTTAYVEEYRGNDEDDDEDRAYCESCDESYDEDDMCHVGRGEDVYLCSGCRDNNYIRVRGSAPRSLYRSGYREYYAHEDEVSSVTNSSSSYSIHTEYPPDDCVQLNNGDWAEMDDCVDIGGEWYLEDDRAVVCLEDTENRDDSYGLKADCYEKDGLYWQNEEHYLEFHPRVSEDEEETEETT